MGGGFDFAMGRIINPIPPHYNVYYQGWSVSIFQGLQLPNCSLHHPRGDIKKWARTYTTIGYTNYSCQIATEVIDVVYKILFGWWTGTEIRTRRICNYLELPYWQVTLWDPGSAMERGSSGSGLLNSQQRLLGVLSG